MVVPFKQSSFCYRRERCILKGNPFLFRGGIKKALMERNEKGPYQKCASQAKGVTTGAPDADAPPSTTHSEKSVMKPFASFILGFLGGLARRVPT